MSQAQASAEQYRDELVKQRLPANLETQARVLGAFQRKRALESAQMLLRPLAALVVQCAVGSASDDEGDLWRLRCAYDLLEGQLAWVQVSDRQVGESFANFPSAAPAGAASSARERPPTERAIALFRGISLGGDDAARQALARGSRVGTVSVPLTDRDPV